MNMEEATIKVTLPIKTVWKLNKLAYLCRRTREKQAQVAIESVIEEYEEENGEIILGEEAEE